MNGTKLESVQCVKDLHVSVASSVKFYQQCKDAAGKANRMLGFINRNISFKTKDAILPLYTSFVRPHQTTSRTCCVILGASLCKGYSETGGRPAQGYKGDYILA